jgi:hypothetical protein
MPPSTVDRKNRRLNVIAPGGHSYQHEEQLKCPECSHFEMHVYKQDPSLYFCSHCITTRPIHDVKRDVVVVPPSDQEGNSFMQQAPKRKAVKKKQGLMEKMLRDQGFNVVDYEEVIS